MHLEECNPKWFSEMSQTNFTLNLFAVWPSLSNSFAPVNFELVKYKNVNVKTYLKDCYTDCVTSSIDLLTDLNIPWLTRAVSNLYAIHILQIDGVVKMENKCDKTYVSTFIYLCVKRGQAKVTFDTINQYVTLIKSTHLSGQPKFVCLNYRWT